MPQAVGLRSQGTRWSGTPSPLSAKLTNSPGVSEDVSLPIDDGLAPGWLYTKHLYSIGSLKRDPLFAVTARSVVKATATVVGVDYMQSFGVVWIQFADA